MSPATWCGPFSRSELANNSTEAPVALKLHDLTRAVLSSTHLSGCVVQKSTGAVAYLVHQASSFRPEFPLSSASERVAWSLAEVYAPLTGVFPFCLTPHTV